MSQTAVFLIAIGQPPLDMGKKLHTTEGMVISLKLDVKRLVLHILLPLGVGTLSWLLSGGMDAAQYPNQPPLSPPPWVFFVVWPILYILMGISAYLIDTEHSVNRQTRKDALWFYYFQLAVNGIWPIVFFRAGLPTAAVAVLVLLLLAVGYTARLFYSIRPLAAYLLLPYLLWLCFALYLNIGVALLNT